MAQERDDRPESPTAPSRSERAAKGGRLDAATRDRIGRNLRVHYAAVLDQPIPDRFRALIDALAAGTDEEAS